MNLERIRKRPVVRAPRSCRLRDAALLMRRHHVGALVVTNDAPDEHRAIGIVTDRDLVLKAIAEGIAPDEANLADVMTEGLTTVKRSADVRAAVETMRVHGVRRLGVTDDEGVIVDFVSFDDLLKGLATEFASLAAIIQTEGQHELEREADAPVVAG
jgi:CBS domain-containing protein